MRRRPTSSHWYWLPLATLVCVLGVVLVFRAAQAATTQYNRRQIAGRLSFNDGPRTDEFVPAAVRSIPFLPLSSIPGMYYNRPP